MANSAILLAEDHSFVVVDGPEFPIETARWSSGVAAQMTTGTMIYTGVNKGRVQVSVHILEEPPIAYTHDLWKTLEGWDDVADISVYAPAGQLAVHQQTYGPFDSPPDLPILSATGPGTYRLRVHAAGRDRYYDKNEDNSEERYHIAVWPADPQPAIVLKSTSLCAYGLRLSDSTRPNVIAAPSEFPPQVSMPKPTR